MAAGKLVLVDAYSQIYRSFYAIRGLTNPQGEPSNALFGMAGFLLRLEQSLPHEYGVVAFDKGKCTQRVELLPDYKGTRPPMPDDLRGQIPRIQQWMEAAGWPTLVEEGREADDLIAAVAHRREGLETFIISADKDLAQLVADGVWLMQPGGKGALNQVGVAQVRDKWGVSPEAIVDYLALVGDVSDNIPGVQGVGAKTAAKLLQQFGSIDEMMQHLDQICSAKLREKLAGSEERLRLNRKLVALDDAEPAGWGGLDSIKRRAPDWPALLDMARENGFKSLVSLIAKAQQAQQNPEFRF